MFWVNFATFNVVSTAYWFVPVVVLSLPLEARPFYSEKETLIRRNEIAFSEWLTCREFVAQRASNIFVISATIYNEYFS